MTQPRVLIVGAGPTGLTAAVELARRGIIPTLIERRDTASNLSRAVGILPASMKRLEPSGVAANIRAEGIAFSEVIFHQGPRVFANVAIGDQILFGLAQDRTEAYLEAALHRFGGDVRYGCALEKLEIDGAIAQAIFASETHEFDIVIGADGVHSAVRRAVNIPYDGYEIDGGWSIADVQAANWPNPSAFQAFLLSPNNVAIVVPLEHNRYRVVSSTPDALAALPVPMDVTKIHRAGTFTISVRQAREYQVGPVFLAGDAAHCHSPVGGRGMNLGIADAADLAARIADGTATGYHTARHPVGKETLKLTERGRRVIMGERPILRYLFKAVLWMAAHFAPFRKILLLQIFPRQ